MIRDKKFSITVRVAEEDYREFTEVADKLGVSKSELLRILIKYFNTRFGFIGKTGYVLNDLYTKLIKAGLNKEKAIYWVIDTLYEYGYSLRNVITELLEFFESDETKLLLIDMDWLKDREGIWFHFVPTKFSNYLFDDMTFQIQKNWDGYAVFSKYFIGEDYRGKIDEIITRLKEAINKLTDEGWIEDVEDELMECADHAEVSLDIDYDKDLSSADLHLSFYVSEWECMPTVNEINNMFRKVLKMANILK